MSHLYWALYRLHRRLHAKNKLEFKRFYKQSRFTIQKNNILCINKFGGKNNSPPKKCNPLSGRPYCVYKLIVLSLTVIYC